MPLGYLIQIMVLKGQKIWRKDCQRGLFSENYSPMVCCHSIVFGRRMVCSFSSSKLGKTSVRQLKTLYVFLAIGSHRRLMSDVNVKKVKADIWLRSDYSLKSMKVIKIYRLLCDNVKRVQKWPVFPEFVRTEDVEQFLMAWVLATWEKVGIESPEDSFKGHPQRKNSRSVLSITRT